MLKKTADLVKEGTPNVQTDGEDYDEGDEDQKREIVRGANRHQICSFFEHCSKSL